METENVNDEEEDFEGSDGGCEFDEELVSIFVSV